MGRRNVLIEGVSGSGKSSVFRELRRRGHQAVDGDRELAYQGDPVTGLPVQGVTGTAVHRHHLWDVDRVRALVADDSAPVTFFCGGSRNVQSFVDLFDVVFVLTVDVDTLRRRLDQRDPDHWAGPGRPAERELVERLHASGEDVPAGTPIDARRPLRAVVDDVLRRC
ncbi:AAA family ATPase [Microbacterium sp. M1A1_1b]